MAKNETQEFLMGDSCKVLFDLDFVTKTLALSVLQKRELSEGEEAEDEWNMISKVFYRSDHPKKLAHALAELAVIDEKTQLYQQHTRHPYGYHISGALEILYRWLPLTCALSGFARGVKEK